MKIARLDEKQVAVARIYCRSILDLAESVGETDSLLEEMQGLLELRDQNLGFQQFMSSPLVDPRERKTLIEKMLRGKLSDLLVNSLQVLNRHGRLDIFETLVEVYRTEHQQRHGQIDVEVTTAVPLSEGLRRELTAAAARMVGREPNLIETVDESLIAGIVVRIGDRKFDTSVATELRGLRHGLSERASQEIHSSRVLSAE